MPPCPSEDLLQRLLAEALVPADRSPLETHVEQCTGCQQTLERLTADPSWRLGTPTPLLTVQGQLPDAARSGVETVTGQATQKMRAAGDLLRLLSPSGHPDSLGRLGEYEVLALVGRGGMGAVFRGVDPRLQRVVALKILLPHLAVNDEARQRFEREARAAAAVWHENIVAVHGVGQADGVPFLVMQYVPGVSLCDWLHNGDPFQLDEVLRIGQEISTGLAAAHARGLVHRDIKPANILLEQGTGRVKITDFGLARAVDDGSLTRSGMVAGTPLYMSPEQADARAVDARSDLFSLGSVLYTLCRPAALRGRHPPRDPQASVRAGPAAPPRDQPGSAGLAGGGDQPPAGQGSGATIPECHGVAEALARPEASTPTEPTPLPRKDRSWLSRRRSIAALAVLLTGGTLAWLWPAPEDSDPLDSLPPPPPPPPAFEGSPPEGPPRLRRQHSPSTLAPTITNRFGMELVRVPKGKFWMGGRDGQPGAREVVIPYDFYLGKYEVTQGEWEAVTGQNPSYFSRTGEGKQAVRDVSDEDLKRFPVESVNIDDIDQFLEQLNQHEKQAGWKYCLPMTEEWEYACRGGPMADPSESAFEFCLEKPTNQLPPDRAHYGHRNSLKRPCKVGCFPPNRLGLHDMHGNVSEWCDADEPSPHGVPSPVYRGGSWNTGAAHCRAEYFHCLAPRPGGTDSACAWPAFTSGLKGSKELARALPRILLVGVPFFSVSFGCCFG